MVESTKDPARGANGLGARRPLAPGGLGAGPGCCRSTSPSAPTSAATSSAPTCNVYERKVDELDADEWGRVFESLGRAPAWMTFSGGEPFLRGDLPDIILVGRSGTASRRSSTSRPTGGSPTGSCAASRRSARAAPSTQLVINLSFDHHVPERHDEIRGAPGSCDRLMDTLAGLRALDLPEPHRRRATPWSPNENEDDFPDIAQGLAKLGADSYIAEPAEERVELQTIGTGITPEASTVRAGGGGRAREREGGQRRGRPHGPGDPRRVLRPGHPLPRRRRHRHAGVPRRLPVDATSAPTATCGRAACWPARSATCATPTSTSARSGSRRGRGVPHVDARAALRLPAGQRRLHQPAGRAGGAMRAWPPEHGAAAASGGRCRCTPS